MAQAVFIVVGSITVLAALAVVSLPNIFHSALALVLALLGVAALYALLGAGYLAVVQVLIYVGAVAILIILAIMVSERFMGRRSLPFNQQWWLSAILSAALFSVLAYLVMSVSWPAIGQQPPQDMVARLGEALVGRYLLPFEVASLALLASLIGAVYIAREK
ncbi:MAG: NADH-quinone oxidoreductase subunit J family protein [Anaerolineae bacterium]